MNPKSKIQKKSGKSPTKKITGWLHLWLGLVSGLIVFVVALSGTLFVFADETIDAIAGNARYVRSVQQQKMPVDELLVKFHEQVPERRAFYIDHYKDAQRSFRIGSAVRPPADAPKGKRIRGTFAYTYMDPYTGEVLKTSKSYEFFYVVAHIHSQLLMSSTGKTIVGIATIIFLVQLIGGLILWWPKKWNKSTRTAAFKVKSGTKWRRKNYDFHNVFGFYALIPAIVLTITGLIMAYDVLYTLTQNAFGGNPEAHELEEQYYPAFDAAKKAHSFQFIADQLIKENPLIDQVRLSLPSDDSETAYYATIGDYIGIKSYLQGRRLVVNKYTGREIKLPTDIVKHEVVEQANFDLHVGYWWGLFGKVITFIVGLICTSLPVTGFLIWWGRRKKKSKTSNVVSSKPAKPVEMPGLQQLVNEG